MSASSALVFRAMAPPDLTAVAELEARAKADPWSPALLAGEFDVSPQARHWLVAEADGVIVGYVGALFVADEAHVLNIVVEPARQGVGIGCVLLCRLLLDALDRGAVSATLEVRADNAPALALYRKLGFESSGTRPRYYPDGSPAVIMWIHKLHRRDRRDRLRQLADL